MNAQYKNFLREISNYPFMFVSYREHSKCLDIIFELSKTTQVSILSCITAYNFVTLTHSLFITEPCIKNIGDKIIIYWTVSSFYVEAEIVDSDFNYFIKGVPNEKASKNAR